MKTETRTLPAHWAPYLINGDATGLDDSDEKECDAYMEREGLPAPVDCGEAYFAWRNDANRLGGDVCEFTFLIHE